MAAKGAAGGRTPTPNGGERGTPANAPSTPTRPPPPIYSAAERRAYPHRTETPGTQSTRVCTPGENCRRGVGLPACVEEAVQHHPLGKPVVNPLWSWEHTLNDPPRPSLHEAAGDFAAQVCGALTEQERSEAAALAGRGDAAELLQCVLQDAGGRNWVSAAAERGRLRSPEPLPRLMNHIAQLDLIEGDQCEVAARVAHALLSVHHSIEQEQPQPVKRLREAQCMRQFRSLFRHCRVPATDWEGRDQGRAAVAVHDGSDYICVLRKGSMFRLQACDAVKGLPLSPAALLHALREVVERAEAAAEEHHPEGGAGGLCALTALPMAQWHAARAALVGSRVCLRLPAAKAGLEGITASDVEEHQQHDGCGWRPASAAVSGPAGGDDPSASAVGAPPSLRPRRTRVVQRVVVTAVAPGSAAEAAGVHAGMQVEELDGGSISTAAKLAAHCAKREGCGCDVTVRAPGDPRSQRAVLCAERALFVLSLDHCSRGDPTGAEARAYIGDGTNRWFPHSLHLVVSADAPAVRKRLRKGPGGGVGLEADAGLRVTQVAPGGAAQLAGIRPGMQLELPGGVGLAELESRAGDWADLGVVPAAGAVLIAEATSVDAVPLTWLAARAHAAAAAAALDAPSPEAAPAPPPPPAEGEEQGAGRTPGATPASVPAPTPAVAPTGLPASGGPAVTAAPGVPPPAAVRVEGPPPAQALAAAMGSTQLHLRADEPGWEGAGMRPLHNLDLDPEALVQVVGALAYHRLLNEVGCGHHLQHLNRFHGGRQLGRVAAATPDVIRFVLAATGHDPSRLYPKGDLGLLLRQACETQEKQCVAAESGRGALTTVWALSALAGEAKCALMSHAAFQQCVAAPPYTAARVCSEHIAGAPTGEGVAMVATVPAAPSKLHFTYAVSDPQGMRFVFVWTDPGFAEYPALFKDSMQQCLELLHHQRRTQRVTVGDLRQRAVHRTR